MYDLNPARARHRIAAALAGLLAMLMLSAVPAGAEPATSIEAWENSLNNAGAAADYDRAAAILTGPVIEAAKPGIEQTLAEWLRNAFGDQGFKADNISVFSTAEKGERRLYALYHENRYAFMFMVFHKRPDGWVVLNFSVEPNYPAIRERF